MSSAPGAFTSDLSVGDFALCHQQGLRAVSQVMGSSVYQIGYEQIPWTGGFEGLMFEMEALSSAWNEVRARALDRLAREAGRVGADAVVGVKLRTGAEDWAGNSIEYVAMGTAVCDRSRPRGDDTVLTDLTVADYAKLRQASIEPVGIVAWSSVFFVTPPMTTNLARALTFASNQEMEEFTQCLYRAREQVVARITRQATEIQASGVIGVDVSHRIGRTSIGTGNNSQEGWMVSFHATGTAVREAEMAQIFAPETTIDLSTRGAPR
jgi:uncharacterized protein YbjQ (UPF0145 family)